MELSAYYLKSQPADTDLTGNSAKKGSVKVIQAWPENEKDLETFVKKAFNGIYRFSKLFGEVYVTPFSIINPAMKYGFLVEAPDVPESIKLKKETQIEEKIYYETKSSLVDALNKQYRSIFKLEERTLLMMDFARMGPKLVDLNDFLELVTQGYSWLEKKDIDVMLRVDSSQITDPFFLVFYLANKDNIFHDPLTNTSFYMTSAPKLSTQERLDFLLRSFEEKFLSNSSNDYDEFLLNQLQNRFSPFSYQKIDTKNFKSVEFSNSTYDIVLSSSLFAIDIDSVINSDYILIPVQLSDINFKKKTWQIFFADRFNDAEYALFMALIDRIIQSLVERELTPYVSQFVLETCPWLPVGSKPIEKPGAFSSEKDLFTPVYRVDVRAYMDYLQSNDDSGDTEEE